MKKIAIPSGSDRKTSGGKSSLLRNCPLSVKEKRTKDMSGVKHDPSLFGKLTPRTKSGCLQKAGVFSARVHENREQHGWSHRAWSCPKSRGWPRLVRIKSTRCGKLYKGFLRSPLHHGLKGCAWVRDAWAGTEAPGR